MPPHTTTANATQRVLVVGAGNAAHCRARVLNNPSLGMEVVGFIDDDPQALGGCRCASAGQSPRCAGWWLTTTLSW
jgi:FlaA1/EpsC-like NDP-sugar epimerase